MCESHYKKARRAGELDSCSVCSVDDCGKIVVAKGLCSMHYARMNRHGTLEGGRNFHRLSNIDPETLKAVCSRCGPTRVRWRKNNWECLAMKRRAELHKSYRQAGRIPRRITSRDGTWFTVPSKEVFQLFVQQKGKCLICKKKFSGERKSTRPHLDHNHDTKQIRGLLCNGCNSAIGMIGENIETAKAMVRYLDE